jgi:hypothetical protein
MPDSLLYTLVAEILKKAGPIAILCAVVILGIVVVVRLLLVAAGRRAEAETRRAESDRDEHIKKWESLVKQHADERDRQYELFNRMAQTQELHAGVLARLTTLVETNQYCPIKRGDIR